MQGSLSTSAAYQHTRACRGSLTRATRAFARGRERRRALHQASPSPCCKFAQYCPAVSHRTVCIMTKAQASQAVSTQHSAKDVVMQYYDCYNTGDLEGVMALFADDCEYHDTVYLEPFKGKEGVRQYYEKVMRIVPGDLKFIVEEITDGDPRRAGVKWHVELEGNLFPFSRGVSFYELNADGKIVSGRDCVELAFKPGTGALQALRLLTPVVRKLGPKADPSRLKDLPIASSLMWDFYLAYLGYVMLSTIAPGEPVWRMPLSQLTEVLQMSVNFFFITVGINAAGIHLVPDMPVHPVYEGLFNFVLAWALMFWPLMLADPPGRKVKNKFGLFIGNMFLTNVFFVPYMALRLAPEKKDADGKVVPVQAPPARMPSYSAAFGLTALVVGLVSVVWVFAARPEFGGLDARWEYFNHTSATNRIFYAFILDAILYTVFQAVLMPTAPARLRFLPFVGQAVWLIQGGDKRQKQG